MLPGTIEISGGTHRLVKHIIRFGVFSFVSVALSSCGSGGTPLSPVQGCTPTGFAMLVRPADPLVAPDHNAVPPGNQELFVAGEGSEVGPGCTSTNLYQYVHAQWVTSDPKIVLISSADDATNGLATCLATTSTVTVSATLTAYGFTQTHSSPAPIICK